MTGVQTCALPICFPVTIRMQFDRGYLSPYFVTNPEKMTTEFNNPFILLYDKKISSLKEMLQKLFH